MSSPFLLICSEEQKHLCYSQWWPHYVASHMATDIQDLYQISFVTSFDSFGFITSSANDFGFDSIFEMACYCICPSEKSLLIGLSCSGSSKNN